MGAVEGDHICWLGCCRSEDYTPSNLCSSKYRNRQVSNYIISLAIRTSISKLRPLYIFIQKCCFLFWLLPHSASSPHSILPPTAASGTRLTPVFNTGKTSAHSTRRSLIEHNIAVSFSTNGARPVPAPVSLALLSPALAVAALLG